ncbi:MAG: dynamin family protein [Clostridium sp.]
MLKIFRKKLVSKELGLEEKLVDINNILYVNTNAAVSQMRAFIEIICKAIFIYEGIEYNAQLKLVDFIKIIEEKKIFKEESIKFFTVCRQIGNNAIHNYIYPTKEEILIYYNQLEKIYEEFQIKYENEHRSYRKELLKQYSKVQENTILNEKKYVLLDGSEFIVPKEKILENDKGFYEKMKKRLNQQLDYLLKVAEKLNVENTNITIAKEKLNGNTFNIVVLGEVNRGKSTLINALLGKNVLPSNILPTTSVITKIIYGEKENALIKFRDGTEKNIELEKLKNYVTTIQAENNRNIKETIINYINTPYKNNCILVDTPGVNDIEKSNVEITYEYIPYADVIIFLIDPDQVFTNSEKVFLKARVCNHNIDKIFFVLNKSDNINEIGIRNLNKYIKNTMEELKLPSRFYIVSAKETLIGKIQGNRNRYVEEFEVLEKEIEKFLFEEKGTQVIKNTLGRNLSIAEEYIYKIRRISSLSDMKIKELTELEKELETQRKEILKGEKEIFRDIDKEYVRVKNKIIDIIHLEMTNSFDVLIKNLKNEKTMSKDRIEKLAEFINNGINNWINARVSPILTIEFNKINNDLIDMMNEKIKKNIGNRNRSVEVEFQKSIVIINNNDIHTCYAPIVENNEELKFLGVGTIVVALISGSLLGGLISGVVGLLLMSNKEGDSTSEMIDVEKIIESIDSKRENIIGNIKNEVINKINNNYENNKKYIKNEINNSINKNIELIRAIANKLEERDTLKSELNNILKKLIIICKQNNNCLEED